MRERAVIRLGGIVGIRKGPTTRGGMIVMKSMPCFFANFHASFSASVLETKYICTKHGVLCSNMKISIVMVHIKFKI